MSLVRRPLGDLGISPRKVRSGVAGPEIRGATPSIRRRRFIGWKPSRRLPKYSRDSRERGRVGHWRKDRPLRGSTLPSYRRAIFFFYFLFRVIQVSISSKAQNLNFLRDRTLEPVTTHRSSQPLFTRLSKG